mgnify:CR=1 FL=1
MAVETCFNFSWRMSASHASLGKRARHFTEKTKAIDAENGPGGNPPKAEAATNLDCAEKVVGFI